MPIRGSPNGAGYLRPQAGRDCPESVVAINRNGWSQSIGMAGRDRPVRAAEIVPSFRKCRIGARGGPQSRFGFNGPAGPSKHVSEVERRRCICRVAFHSKAIKPFGLSNVTDLLGDNGPIE